MSAFHPSPPELAAILTVDAVREVEARGRDAPLMERAGAAAAEDARGLLTDRDGRVLVLAGPGNNGGDAFVLARLLQAGFHDVTAVFAADAARLPRDAAAAHAAFVAAGGRTMPTLPRDWNGGLVIDGLFGIGIGRPIGAPYADWIEWVNTKDVPVLALDVPSGLDAQTGNHAGPVVQASATSTFIALKPGLLTGEGPDACGDVHVHTLGLADEIARVASGKLLRWARLAAALPEVLQRRRKNVHKGIFGTLGVIGGATGMLGAPLLAARAALRAGAGRVRVGYVAQAHPAVDFGAPELMLRDARGVLDAGADVLVIGPGLGTEDGAHDLLRDALALEVPLVLDADALNLIAREADLRERLRTRARPSLLTPHPAEASRLLGTSTKEVQADRLAACLELARELRAEVVLKGAGSVIAGPDGAWDINASGNSALSAAGSGDVLAGFAGAMLAQGLPARDALRYAVCLHGAAADHLVAQHCGPLGLVAGELADAARTLVNDAARALSR